MHRDLHVVEQKSYHESDKKTWIEELKFINIFGKTKDTSTAIETAKLIFFEGLAQK